MKKTNNVKAAWISAGALILSAIIAGLFTLFNNPQIKTDIKGNENVISSDTVEGNKYVIEGDNIQGDKNIYNLTEDNIRKVVEETLRTQEKERDTKYPYGHFGFGIVKDSFIVPKGLIPSDIEVDWSTGKVLKETDKNIDLLIPSMTFKSIKLWNNRVILKKQIGLAQKAGYRVDNIRMLAEILGIDKTNDLIIIGIGFVEVQS